MMPDEMIDAAFKKWWDSTADEGIKYDRQDYICYHAGATEFYPLIRQQVLKEVYAAICGLEYSKDLMYGEGVPDCQCIVCEMMEGGE
jgi:hypothetical protein